MKMRKYEIIETIVQKYIIEALSKQKAKEELAYRDQPDDVYCFDQEIREVILK